MTLAQIADLEAQIATLAAEKLTHEVRLNAIFDETQVLQAQVTAGWATIQSSVRAVAAQLPGATFTEIGAVLDQQNGQG